MQYLEHESDSVTSSVKFLISGILNDSLHLWLKNSDKNSDMSAIDEHVSVFFVIVNCAF